MVIPRYAACLIEKLNDAGYHTAAVGGCVRDSLLGRIRHDWDLTTAAPWQDVKALLSSEYAVIATGTQHGTVTVLSEGHPVEITTFRIDGRLLRRTASGQRPLHKQSLRRSRTPRFYRKRHGLRRRNAF